MDTVTVTIGRNVGPAPMSSERWNRFLSDTRNAVESATVEVWASGPSKSEWAGHKEENFFYYGPLVNDDAKRYLRTRLEVLASYYGQDAIGVSFGESELLHSFAMFDTEEGEDTDIFSSPFDDDIAIRQQLASAFNDGKAV